MTKHYNKKSEKQKRRELRNNSTFGEKLLWMYLSKRQICSERFLRQYSVDFYVIDFYCPRLHLAVESDGPLHFIDEEAIKYDKHRQEYIEKFGIQFIRFTDEEVRWNTDKVISMIEERVKKLQEENPPCPPFRKRGECGIDKLSGRTDKVTGRNDKVDRRNSKLNNRNNGLTCRCGETACRINKVIGRSIRIR